MKLMNSAGLATSRYATILDAGSLTPNLANAQDCRHINCYAACIRIGNFYNSIDISIRL